MAYNPMAWMPKWVGQCARARFQIEALEERALLTIAGFEMNLYADVGGVPGELIASDTVEVGESFFVEITAEDRRPDAAPLAGQSPGIRGLALDIAWDPANFEAIDAPFETASGIVTESFPLFRGGSLDNGEGRIDDLQGTASLSMSAGEVIGDDGPEQFALLHFRALDAVESSAFSMNLGLRQISMFPSVPFIRVADFEFETQTITVVDPADNLPATSPGTQINIYETGNGALLPPIRNQALDANQSYFVEIILAPPATSTPTEAIRADAAVAAAASSIEPADSTSATSRLDVTSLPLFADGTLDLSAGELWVTRIAVEVNGVTVDLPVAAGPLQSTEFEVHHTRRIGLTYWPLQPDAADAALATVPIDALDAAAGVQLDQALLQALASGLAAPVVDDDTDPFSFLRLPSEE